MWFSCFTLCALRRKWDLRLLQRPMNHSLLALQHLPVLSRPPPAARLPLSNTRYVLTHAFTAYSKRGRQGDGSVGCDFISRSPPNGFSNSCNSFTVTNGYTPWHLVFLTGPTPTHGVRLVKDSRYPSPARPSQNAPGRPQSARAWASGALSEALHPYSWPSEPNSERTTSVFSHARRNQPISCLTALSAN